MKTASFPSLTPPAIYRTSPATQTKLLLRPCLQLMDFGQLEEASESSFDLLQSTFGFSVSVH